ncbi:hypothetical protein ACFQO1_09695 [Jejudonia soesokkakensis]|uniref:TonB C-terminal domain-containing protein n=1 Tax=Jejudonia soesokkakensis TaxID=1323432 RepID=A0ABW2MWK2_9FLAO
MKAQDKNGTEVTTTVRSKRLDKKSINIKSRTVRYFQFGLLIGLFAVLLILEANIGFTTNSYAAPRDLNLEEEPGYVFTLEEKQPIAKAENPIKKRAIQRQIITNIIKTKKDNTPIDDSQITTTEVTNKPIEPKNTPSVVATPSVSDKTESMINVEFVPVFPGCEKYSSNNDKVSCMSSKINAFISKKFRTNDFDHLEKGDIHKIYVQFTIDKKGFVTNVKARALNKKLEEEAKRVISQLPIMEAGKQGNTSVNVAYSIPITFQVSN